MNLNQRVLDFVWATTWKTWDQKSYLTKSLPISFKHGINVPQYGESDRMLATLGIMNKASRLSTSKDFAIMGPSCLDRPTIPGNRKLATYENTSVSVSLQPPCTYA